MTLKPVLKGGDHGSGDLDHEVMPLVAVFAAEVHPQPRAGAVDQQHLGMVRRKPGVKKRPGLHAGILGAGNRAWRWGP